MHELRGQDTVRYIWHLLISYPNPSAHYKQLAAWLRESSLIKGYLHIILGYPLKAAKTAFILLTRLDNQVPMYLTKMVASLSSEKCLKVLSLLEELHEDSKVTSMLIRPLAEHKNAGIRGQAIYLIGRTSQNTLFMHRFLKDPAAKVRLRVLESIEESPDKRSSKIVNLLHDTLEDPDIRVRGKAAQILYLQRVRQGLKTLTDMLESQQPLERAWAVRIFGELKEVSVYEKLKTLAEDDVNERVRVEAQKALKVFDEECTILNQRFGELEGLLTRYRFSKDNLDNKDLWEQLDGLDDEVIEGMLQSIGLTCEVVQQFKEVIKEFGG